MLANLGKTSSRGCVNNLSATIIIKKNAWIDALTVYFKSVALWFGLPHQDEILLVSVNFTKVIILHSIPHQHRFIGQWQSSPWNFNSLLLYLPFLYKTAPAEHIKTSFRNLELEFFYAQWRKWELQHLLHCRWKKTQKATVASRWYSLNTASQILFQNISQKDKILDFVSLWSLFP